MTKAVKRNRGRLVLISILAVSLLGNAVAGGAYLRLHNLKNELGASTTEPIIFPPEQRKLLRHTIEAQSDILRPEIEALIATRAEVVKLGTAAPFDRAAVDEAMNRFRVQLNNLVIILQVLMVDALEADAQQNQ